MFKRNHLPACRITRTCSMAQKTGNSLRSTMTRRNSAVPLLRIFGRSERINHDDDIG